MFRTDSAAIYVWLCPRLVRRGGGDCSGSSHIEAKPRGSSNMLGILVQGAYGFPTRHLTCLRYAQAVFGLLGAHNGQQ